MCNRGTSRARRLEVGSAVEGCWFEPCRPALILPCLLRNEVPSAVRRNVTQARFFRFGLSTVQSTMLRTLINGLSSFLRLSSVRVMGTFLKMTSIFRPHVRSCSRLIRTLLGNYEAVVCTLTNSREKSTGGSFAVSSHGRETVNPLVSQEIARLERQRMPI